MHSLVKQKENLTLRQKSLRALFHAPLHMWVEFVVGSRPFSEKFFSGFPLSSKTNIPKFQFDLESVPN